MDRTWVPDGSFLHFAIHSSRQFLILMSGHVDLTWVLLPVPCQTLLHFAFHDAQSLLV